MAVHASGDHVLVGSDDRRLAWCVQHGAHARAPPLRRTAVSAPGAPTAAPCGPRRAVARAARSRRYDLDLSDKPYKALRYHTTGVRGAAFHRTYPLFASCADDAAVHVFHGMVRIYGRAGVGVLRKHTRAVPVRVRTHIVRPVRPCAAPAPNPPLLLPPRCTRTC